MDNDGGGAHRRCVGVAGAERALRESARVTSDDVSGGLHRTQRAVQAEGRHACSALPALCCAT